MNNHKEKFLKEIDGWEELFKRCFAYVYTRGSSYCFDTKMIIPYFDCINHSHKAESDYYMVNKELHVDPLREEAYFIQDKYLNDVSLLYKTGSDTDKEALENELTKGYQVGTDYE